MLDNFHYHFEWDPAKAIGNQRKHLVTFNLATTVFLDLLMVSIPDTQHSNTEKRWITIGQAINGKLLVISHTYQEIDNHTANVRIISARPASKHEQRQYEAYT